MDVQVQAMDYAIQHVVVCRRLRPIVPVVVPHLDDGELKQEVMDVHQVLKHVIYRKDPFLVQQVLLPHVQLLVDEPVQIL
jgi:hypothetical protein